MSVDFFDGTDGVTITCEVALAIPGGRYSLWGRSLWGRAAWGPGVIYQDLSNRIRGLGTVRRFNRTLDRWQSGTGWVLLHNADGELSPANLGSSFADGTISTVIPGRRIRLRATRGGVTYGLISGVCDDWQEEIISAGPSKGDAAVRIPIADDWAELAAVDPVPIAATGAGQRLGARVSMILDAAGWTGDRSLDLGEVTLQATTLSRSATSELAITADSEGGLIWPDADGVMRATSRYARVTGARSTTVQATFGDVDPAHLRYADPKPTFDRALIVNQAVFSRVDGAPQIVTDESSRHTYRLKRTTRTDLICETDDQALGLAKWHIAQYRQPRRRIERITVSPRSDPDTLWPVVLGSKELDLIRVIHHPPGGYADDFSGHLAGISHTALPGGQWKTSFDLWSASPHLDFSESRWGTARWGRSKWFI